MYWPELAYKKAHLFQPGNGKENTLLGLAMFKVVVASFSSTFSLEKRKRFPFSE